MAATRKKAPGRKTASVGKRSGRGGDKRWIACEADERAYANGCRFDEAAAARVVEFFRRFLRHSKGEWAGKPFELLAWQRDEIVYPLFGWKRADGTRRFRKAGVWIPKKNGKSTLAAGIGIYMLCADGEQGAEVYSAACDQSQAMIVHGEAVNMVEASEPLQSVLRVNHSTHVIAMPGTRSFYKALTAEERAKEGLNASCIIKDELHVWFGRKMFDALRYAFRARKQGLDFEISTAGDDMQSVGRQQYEYAKNVLSGAIVDERFFAFVREADEKADNLEDPATWRKANPSMGITIEEKEFGADLKEAQATPASWASFKRYSFNIWISATNPAIDMNDWEACRQKHLEAELAGRECVAGLDLAQKNDMSALVLVFPDGEEGTEQQESRPAAPDPQRPMADARVDQMIETVEGLRARYRVLSYFWMPEGTIWGVKNVNAPLYRGWLEHGHLRKTSGNEVDDAFIRAEIVRLALIFQLKALVYDPAFAGSMVRDLEENHGISRVEFTASGYNQWAAPCVLLERSILGHRLAHDGQPILTWHMGNLAWKTNPAGYKRPVKPPEGEARKIDGAVALIMGLYGASSDAVLALGKSRYENEKPMVIG